jgi:hypothetical protein
LNLKELSVPSPTAWKKRRVFSPTPTPTKVLLYVSHSPVKKGVKKEVKKEMKKEEEEKEEEEEEEEKEDTEDQRDKIEDNEMDAKQEESEEKDKEESDMNAKLAEKYKDMIGILGEDFDLATEENDDVDAEVSEAEEEPAFDEFIYDTLGENADKVAFMVHQVKEKVASISHPEEKQK